METGLKGNPLPDNASDFVSNVLSMKNLRCMSCGESFSEDNVMTSLGWRETQISGFCEVCFDGLFKDE